MCAQVLSIRPDVLPPPVMVELAKLQDGIAPFPTAEARRVVESELGRPVDEVFSEFGERPVAAASLAQVRTRCWHKRTRPWSRHCKCIRVAWSCRIAARQAKLHPRLEWGAWWCLSSSNTSLLATS